MKTPLFGSFPLLLLAAGCGARPELAEGPCDLTADTPPQCVAPSADPCGPPATVAPVCDTATRAYRCPEGARPYARAADSPATCLPFSDPAGPIRALGGSLVRVPTDDGRCLWVAEQVETADGHSLRNVAFAPDPAAPFGACPTKATPVGGSPGSIVHMDGGDDPSFLVQVAQAFRLAGKTTVVYRLFEVDQQATFGVTLLGSGLGTWDAGTQRIVVPGPSALPFPTSLNLGDASLVAQGSAFVWGCPTQDGLMERCVVTRFDPGGGTATFAGAAGWRPGLDGAAGATVFESGPWISSVVPDAASGGLLHVYAIGFGTTLETHLAPAPEGPWAAGASIGPCALPSGDAHAFCAGPVVHEELADPTRPGEIVVSYGVASTAPSAGALSAARPEDYWTRLVWVGAP